LLNVEKLKGNIVTKSGRHDGEVLGASSMHAHLLLLYYCPKTGFSSQNYDPIPCIHVKATGKNALP